MIHMYYFLEGTVCEAMQITIAEAEL